jgi:NAD(P)-dependent dehydrogenase (short-subunit alcohol dehydrogenase family)
MKKAVVTGGSSGIGAAVAELLSASYDVYILDAQKPNGSLKHYQVDVTDASKLKSALQEIGDVAVVVHAAGIYLASELTEMSDDDIFKQVDVNLVGTGLVNKYALQHMSSGGVIVNVASSLGVVPEPESPMYCASKAGIIMLTKALAQRYASQQIRINAILPGPIDTPLLREAFPTEQDFSDYEKLNPMGRVGRPEEVAKLVNYLISDDATYITGACMAIDGGESSSSLYSPVRR